MSPSIDLRERTVIAAVRPLAMVGVPFNCSVGSFDRSRQRLHRVAGI